MSKFITLSLVGIILIVLGIINVKGDVSSIHWYNRRKVSEKDIPRYAKCMGTGSLIIGIAFIISTVAEAVFKTDIFDYMMISGCVVGLIVMLYGQIKYNKGIF
jgi:hypothetical protein